MLPFLFHGVGLELFRTDMKPEKTVGRSFRTQCYRNKNALKSADYIYKNPQARAEDLMEAFSDSSVKAIISNIGGDDSIRTLPFTDLSVIRNNPKIFLGFSDTTVTHVACYKAGLTSFTEHLYWLVLLKMEACINTR